MLPWFRAALTGLAIASGFASGLVASPAGLDLETEVPVASRLVSGRLANGLRYAILPHTARPGAASLRLLVDAGSLDEHDDERGYAHFIEHMAFKGTRHFPAGELVKFLQREGVKFGPHLNAETSYNHTLYRLDFTTATPAQLETGLRVLRDFADGILLEPDEVERERTVILSEDFLRRTPLAAQNAAQTSFLFAGTLLPERPPIGAETTIRSASAARLRDFYATSYHPERLSVIVVGDLDPAATETLIRTQFASIAAATPVRATVATGSPRRSGAVAVALHPSARESTLRLQIGLVWPDPAGPPRWDDIVRETALQAATQMLSRRLDRLAKSHPAPFSNVAVVSSVPCRGFRELNIVFLPGPGGWQTGLAALEQEIRRVAEHGFTAEEIVLHQRLAQDNLRRAVEAESVAAPAALAGAIVGAFDHGAQFYSVAEQHESMARIVDGLSPTACQHAVREILAHGPFAVFVSGPAPLLPASNDVAAVFTQSSAVAVSPPVPEAPVEFAYRDFGPAGAVVRREHVPDLDLWLIEFANGVRLSLKRTPFEPGQVRCRVRLGHGRLVEPPEHPGLSMWTSAWFAGGLGRHDWAAIARLGDAHNLAVTCTRETDAFLLGGRGRPAQLDLLLGILTAYLADPAFRAEGFAATTATVDRAVRPRYAGPEGAVQVSILPRLAGGDPRIGTPPADILFANTHEQLRDWLAPIVATARPEVALVGDLDPETATAAVARTFGALPSRTPPPLDPARRTLHFLAPPVTETIDITGETPRPARLELFWRTGDSLSPRQRWQLAQLAAVLEDRVRVRVREGDGATYAVRASFSRTAAYTGFATLRCSLDVNPEHAARYLDAVRDIAAELARRGVTAEELARAQAPLLASARAGRSSNAYWLDEVLAEAQSDPERLPAARTLESDITSATPADLTALAARYLQPEQCFRFAVLTHVTTDQSQPMQ